MRMSASEFLRAQIDAPLLKRRLWFLILSLVLLLPLSVLWSCGSVVRSRRRIKRDRPESGAPWIVSIGNVAVGGTGKSPIVRALARKALAQGWDVGIITRGVGQPNATAPILKLTSESSDLQPEHWQTFGDEILEHALQLRSALPRGGVLWLSQGSQRKRVLESIEAFRRSSANSGHPAEPRRPFLVLLDDALQQTDVEVHRDIVVWDPATVIVAPRFCLPFGPYRMGFPWQRPWAASLPRADVVVWSRMRSPHEKTFFMESVERAQMKLFHPASFREKESFSSGARSTFMTDAPTQWIAEERKQLARLSDRSPDAGFALEVAEGKTMEGPVHILTGIGRPARFVASFHDYFEQRGLPAPVVESSLHLADHGGLNPEAMNILNSESVFVTTLKDACRWWMNPSFRAAMRAGRVYVLALEVDFSSIHGKPMEVFFETIRLSDGRQTT